MILATLFGRLLCRFGLHDVSRWYRPQYDITWEACQRDGCTWTMQRKGGHR